MTDAIPVLVGPTGSGKTAVALDLARRLDADVISADSRQVYKRLAAGTAKPAGRWVHDARRPVPDFYDVDGVPHHLMDILEPTETYNAGLFARQADEILTRLSSKRRRCLLVGGTGLYLKALADGLAPLPPRDEALRKELLAVAGREGRAALHRALAAVDPAAAAKIPPNNIARVVRALEVHRLTGRPLSWWQKEKTTPAPWRFRWFGLRWPKNVFEEHLAARCRAMADGLLAETDALLREGVPADAPALQALGYREAVAHARGEITRAQFDERFFRATRQYVKRQITWFRADERVTWIDARPPFDPVALAEKILSSGEVSNKAT